MANNQPIIVKKRRKGHHDEHHGGAWKVAYADFVTAMMAFFLLLWLLNATTEEQKRGIADYFAPSSVSTTTSGSGGILGGQELATEGARASQAAPPGIIVEIPKTVAKPEEEESKDESEAKSGQEVSEEELREAQARLEEQNFTEAENALRQAMHSVPELAQLEDSLIIDRTDEGLRIQIVDQEGLSMVPLGSADMYGHTQALLGQVAQVIQSLPNRISITGHTDALQYAKGKGYSNWELSSDRANASRRALIDAGLDPARVLRVEGKAETDPLHVEDTEDPRNRRISIVLMRQSDGGANGDSLPPGPNGH
ncbi:MAG: flagellar motor protein MotB [Alphaproteobacteria bacterium]